MGTKARHFEFLDGSIVCKGWFGGVVRLSVVEVVVRDDHDAEGTSAT